MLKLPGSGGIWCPWSAWSTSCIFPWRVRGRSSGTRRLGERPSTSWKWSSPSPFQTSFRGLTRPDLATRESGHKCSLLFIKVRERRSRPRQMKLLERKRLVFRRQGVTDLPFMAIIMTCYFSEYLIWLLFATFLIKEKNYIYLTLEKVRCRHRRILRGWAAWGLVHKPGRRNAWRASRQRRKKRRRLEHTTRAVKFGKHWKVFLRETKCKCLDYIAKALPISDPSLEKDTANCWDLEVSFLDRVTDGINLCLAIKMARQFI